MSHAQVNTTFEEVENAITAARTRLLYHSANGTRPFAGDPIFSFASEIGSMIAETAATMSEPPISELMSAIDRLRSTGSDEADSAIRDALDRIADVESFLVNSRRDLSELDVSSFIEASFSHLVAESPPPDEALSEETELDPDIAEIFFAEADDLLSAIEQNLALMSTGQNTDVELWNMRRAAHTFKGSAGMVGLADLSRTAHKIEDVIESLSETAEAERAGVILQLRSLVDELRTNLPNAENTPKGDRQGEADQQMSPDALQNAGPPEVSVDPVATQLTSENVQLESRDTVLRLNASRLRDLESDITSALVDSRRIADRFDELFSQHQELLDAGYRLSNATERMRLAGLRLPDAIVPEVLENEAAPHDPTTFDQEDDVVSFAECTYKLEETASDILMINAQASSLLGTLKGVLDAREEQLELLRRKVSGLRVVDLGIIQNRLERAARVAAEETERIVELHFPDAQVSIDAQMLELLTEPLLHIVRNAVVHGIETPDERRFLGKSECGNITIRCCKTPISISIEIADDGAGISMAHLRQKAVESGRYEAAEAYRASDNEIIDLIFTPGFTTARELTLTAGRGIGMSIVKAGIESLGGTIDVDTTPQLGTRFVINLPLRPLTLAVAVVEVAGKKIGIPAGFISEVVNSSDYDVRLRDGELRFMSLLKDIPALDLSNSFSIISYDQKAREKKTALIALIHDEEWALIVDRYLGTEEMFTDLAELRTKNTDTLFATAHSSNGTTLPIVNIESIVRTRDVSQIAEDRTPETSMDRSIDILIVDDSPSARRKLVSALSNTGWSIAEACNGQEAVELLESGLTPLVVLSDVEMPELNGFELTSWLRSSNRFCLVPIVVISSRADEKHRSFAAKIGANRYLVKPFQTEELNQIIRDLMSSVDLSVVEYEVDEDPV